MVESSMDLNLFASLLTRNLQILKLDCTNAHLFGTETHKDNVLRVVFKHFCGYKLKLSKCHFGNLDQGALEAQEWGCMQSLRCFKLQDVKSGFTSAIAGIIIDKLVQMPNLERVKLNGIKLEDKP